MPASRVRAPVATTVAVDSPSTTKLPARAVARRGPRSRSAACSARCSCTNANNPLSTTTTKMPCRAAACRRPRRADPPPRTAGRRGGTSPPLGAAMRACAAGQVARSGHRLPTVAPPRRTRGRGRSSCGRQRPAFWSHAQCTRRRRRPQGLGSYRRRIVPFTGTYDPGSGAGADPSSGHEDRRPRRPLRRMRRSMQQVRPTRARRGLHRAYVGIGIDGPSTEPEDVGRRMSVERGSEARGELVDETDRAALDAIRLIVTGSRTAGLTSSRCLQAPPNRSRVVELAVRQGITSTPVGPDEVDGSRRATHAPGVA
jgi:hypothetical protein